MLGDCWEGVAGSGCGLSVGVAPNGLVFALFDFWRVLWGEGRCWGTLGREWLGVDGDNFPLELPRTDYSSLSLIFGGFFGLREGAGGLLGGSGWEWMGITFHAGQWGYDVLGDALS